MAYDASISLVNEIHAILADLAAQRASLAAIPSGTSCRRRMRRYTGNGSSGLINC
jgi:hypothetical protein